VRSALSDIIRNKLRRILAPAPQSEAPPKPNKQEQTVAEKQARAAATARVVEQKIELGRKLVALRAVTPVQTAFGDIVRHRFVLHASNSVTEMMPEIFRNVSCHALTEVPSSATSDTERRRFETMIDAGKRVTGAQIIRVR
jgi:hypothetical protein